jgi:hypothetical protein
VVWRFVEHTQTNNSYLNPYLNMSDDDDDVVFGYEDEDGNVTHHGYEDDDDDAQDGGHDAGERHRYEYDEDDPRQQDHEAYKAVQRQAADATARYHATDSMEEKVEYGQEARGFAYEYEVVLAMSGIPLTSVIQRSHSSLRMGWTVPGKPS